MTISELSWLELLSSYSDWSSVAIFLAFSNRSGMAVFLVYSEVWGGTTFCLYPQVLDEVIFYIPGRSPEFDFFSDVQVVIFLRFPKGLGCGYF